MIDLKALREQARLTPEDIQGRWKRGNPLPLFEFEHVVNLASDHAFDIGYEAGVKAGEITELRKWLWLNHGCPIAALYGDDGEMQCGNHRHPLVWDFQRQPIIDILKAERERLAGVADAIQLQLDNFERQRAAGQFLGDDDHEAWAALSTAQAAIRREVKP